MLRAEMINYHSQDFSLRVDFSVKAGTKLALTGPSGGGKSTLLAMIEGALSLSGGRLMWQGDDIALHAPAERPVASLFQNHALFPHLTLAENIALGGDISDDALFDLARSVGIAEALSRRPDEVSGGQAQRAAIARLILQNKPISLLDEPFAALGPRLRRELLTLVTARAFDPTRIIILVTHHPEEIRAWADEVIFVDKGHVTRPMTTEAFFESDDDAIRAYL